MITIVASIIGFLSSLIPDIIRLFGDKRDKEHELRILNLQVQMQKQKRNDQNITRLEEIKGNNVQMEKKFLYGTYFSGNKTIDAINASVRPILAYSFFLLYLGSKIMQFVIIDSQTETMLNILDQYLEILWSESDQAIFAGIISFYYGQRSFSKLKRA